MGNVLTDEYTCIGVWIRIMKDVAQHLMLLNAVMAMALKNGSNRESVARSMKVMEHEWVVDICPAEGLAEEGRRGMTFPVVEPVMTSWCDEALTRLDDGLELCRTRELEIAYHTVELFSR